MAAPKMKTTPDAGLATVGAIKFRINALREELLKGQDTKTLLGRINALRARLPADDSDAPKNAVDTSLLTSKSQQDEFGSKGGLYS